MLWSTIAAAGRFIAIASLRPEGCPPLRLDRVTHNEFAKWAWAQKSSNYKNLIQVHELTATRVITIT